MNLADAFAGDAEFFADFFEGFALAAIETEAGINDAFFSIIEDIDEIAEFVAEILVAQLFERGEGLEIADDFAELGGVVVTDGSVERSGANGDDLELGDFAGGETDFFGEFFVGGFATEFFAHLHGDAAHFGDFVNEMNGEADGL